MRGGTEVPRRLKATLLLVLATRVFAADTIYWNGFVVTMDSANRTVEAMAVGGGKVLAAGTNAEVRKHAQATTKVIDLKGKTIVPGFYAAHDHFPASGVVALYQVDLNSPPVGAMRSIADIQQALRKKVGQTPAGEWVIGRGYDDTLLAEMRHPTRADLDAVSTQHPIYVVHTSGHLGVANSKALTLAGITRQTPQPAGGVIRRDAGGEPTGVIEESLGLITKHTPDLTLEQTLQAIRWAGRQYASKGVTTTVIAGAARSRVVELKTAIARGFLPLRVNVMLSGAAAPEKFSEAAGFASANGQLRVSGVKLFHDGSIQGYTGFLSAPYHKQPEGKPDYRGYPSRSKEALAAQVEKLHAGRWPIAIHGNGDAAIDDILAAYGQAEKSAPWPGSRHRIEHCQTPRLDQLDRIRELGVSPSFFEAHVYYWGDRHRDIFLGPVRGARISPLASARQRGIRFTLHNDTPVTPVDPLLLIWAAVMRQTRNGQILGADERISAVDALRAVTIDAAWQNFEEQTKGSLEPGKLADFVILEQNPLTVPAAKIKDIPVLETVVGGQSIFLKSN